MMSCLRIHHALWILSVGLSLASCTDKDYYPLDHFSVVPKIDAHVHIRTDRDAFAVQAVRDNFKLVNIVVDGASTWQGVRDQFEFAVLQQQSQPDLFKTISAFSVEDFHEPGWSERCILWVDSCFAQGAIGIKVWKNIGMVLRDSDSSNVMLDDTRFDTIIDHLAEQDKILFGHLGEPLNCWLSLEEMTTNNDRSYFEEHPQYHMYLHPDLPSYHDQMSARDRRLDKHPELTFVGAHMASIEWDVDTLAAWLDTYPQATIDLAARMGQVFYQTQQNRDRVRNFFLKYQNRVMYATDVVERGTSDAKQFAENLHETWMRDWRYFVTDEKMESDLIDGSFQGIKLPREAVDNIYYETAARIFQF